MEQQVVLGERSALLLVDVQRGFEDVKWGRRNNALAEQLIAKLLAAFRAVGLPIHHVQHASASPAGSFQPGEDGFLHKDLAKPLPSEPVHRKTVNSAFIGTSLENDLRADGIDALVIVGLTTNHCVSTTARMSGNLGFKTFVVRDATATFERCDLEGQAQTAEQVHNAALSDLQEEFATIVSTQQILDAISLQCHNKDENLVQETPSGQRGKDAPSPEAQAYINRITGNLRGQEPFLVLKSTIGVVKGLLRGASEHLFTIRSDPSKWSVAEILAHLADTEIVLSFRLRQILSRSGIEIAAYDQDLWAVVSEYSTIPSFTSLKQLSVNREANLRLMDRLNPDQMNMYGVHAERGVETVGQLLRMWAGHDLNHIRQIENLLATTHSTESIEANP